MSPAVRPFLELLPLSAIVASVYCAMKEEGMREIAWSGAKFFVRMYGGVILFSAAIHILCSIVR